MSLFSKQPISYTIWINHSTRIKMKHKKLKCGNYVEKSQQKLNGKQDTRACARARARARVCHVSYDVLGKILNCVHTVYNLSTRTSNFQHKIRFSENKKTKKKLKTETENQKPNSYLRMCNNLYTENYTFSAHSPHNTCGNNDEWFYFIQTMDCKTGWKYRVEAHKPQLLVIEMILITRHINHFHLVVNKHLVCTNSQPFSLSHFATSFQ